MARQVSNEQIATLIKAHQIQSKRERANWNRYIAWYRSEFWGPNGPAVGNDNEVTAETNYTYAFVDSLASSVVPPNPQVTIDARSKKLGDTAKFRESYVNDRLNQNKTSKLLWRMTTFSSICGRGYMKGYWRHEKKRPEFKIIDPAFIWFDLSAQRWEDIRYLIEVTVMTEEEFNEHVENEKRYLALQEALVKLSEENVLNEQEMATLRAEAEAAPRGFDPKVGRAAQPNSLPVWFRETLSHDRNMYEVSSAFKWVIVYEVFDFVGSRHMFWIDNTDAPLTEDALPFTSVENPYQPLIFNDNLKDLRGLSDIQIIDRLQQMLNELDTLELRHAQATIPVTLVDESKVDNVSTAMKKLQDATSPGDMVALALRDQATIGDAIGQTPTAMLSPNFQTIRQRIISSIEFTLGIAQFQRGVVGATDVATEVALADAAIRTRNGRRLQAIQDVIEWMARTIIGLADQFLPKESQLYLRTNRREDGQVIKKVDLFPPSELGDARYGTLIEDSLEYDFNVIPFSPTENSKVIQFGNLQKVLDLLLNNENINSRKLLLDLLEILSIDPDIVYSEEELAKQQQAQQEQQAAELAAQQAGQPTQQGKAPQNIKSPAGPIAGPGGEIGPLSNSPVSDFTLPPSTIEN